MTITGKAIKTNEFAYINQNIFGRHDSIRRRIYQVGNRKMVKVNYDWQDLSWYKDNPLYTVYVDIY